MRLAVWQWEWKRWLVLSIAAALLALGCGVNEPPVRGMGVLGAACQHAGDCASGLCVTLTGAPGAVCSSGCQADADCPGVNWACAATPGAAQKACACTRLGESEVCGDGVDNDCDGRTDCQSCTTATGEAELECGGVCVDGKNDVNNCGGCGVVCSLGRTCVEGACACPAVGPDQFCSGVGCVDLLGSAQNCGKCGLACEAGRSCVEGRCECAAGTTLCDGGCADIAKDAANCGQCGAACGAGLACIDGTCTCPAGDHVLCGSDCSDLTSDARHCGECSKACGSGESCEGARCRCASGLYCGGACVAVDDSQNCGACGNACPAGQACAQGRCVCQGAGLTACGADCVSLPDDASHCGNCAARCSSTEACNAGACACPAGKTYCAATDRCLALASDAANCGACGHACAPSEICVSSKCTCPGANQRYCEASGGCVDVLSSDAHCGDCDTACETPLSCVQGDCGCAGGKTFCAVSKSCADLQNDEKNCGACGNACGKGAHCAGGQCACDVANQTVCGSTCHDLKTDPLACGACDHACGGSYACVDGACRCPNPQVGTPVLVANSVRDEALRLAWDGKHVALLYYRFVPTKDQNVHFVLLGADGGVVPSSDRIVAPLGADYDVVSSGSEFAIALDKTIAGTVSFQRLDASGSPKAPAQVLSVGNVQRVRLAWSKQNGYYLAYANSESNIANWTVPLGVDGTTVGTAYAYGSGSKPFVSNFLVGGDGTLALLLSNDYQQLLLTMDSSGRARLPVAGLTLEYAQRAGAVGYDEAGYFAVWPLSRSIFVNRGVQYNEPPAFVDIGAGKNLRSLSMAQAARSVAVSWTWHLTSQAVSKPSSFAVQRFGPPDAQTGAMQPITDAIDLTSNSKDNARIVSTGENSLLAVWTTPEGNLYAAPIDFQSCP